MQEPQPRLQYPGRSLSVHIDTVSNMLLRRELNETFARKRTDFYALSLAIGQELLGESLTPQDIVGDIGGSYGDFIFQALDSTKTEATAICVDPNEDAELWYTNTLARHKKERVKFLAASGEALSIRPNTFRLVMLHNVIFRTEYPVTMLQEVSNATVDGGVVALSTNYQGHAPYRHDDEANVARVFKKRTGRDVIIPKPPAEGKYVDDLPTLIKQACLNVDLYDPSQARFVKQNTHSVITAEHIPDYLGAIYGKAAELDIPEREFILWRRIVDEVIAKDVEDRIAASPNGEFLDPIKRGMFVFINQKS